MAIDRSKIKGAPDYDEAAYWDIKFANGQDVGEWLNPGEILLDAVMSGLESRGPFAPGKKPRVLHLGPGISKLGSKLCDIFVNRGWRGDGIVNADFSAEAVRFGQEYESKKPATETRMHWQQTDLRSWTDMSNLSPFAPFDVILDKSTSDAVATGPLQSFSPSDALTCPTVLEIVQNKNEGIALSPVELLALHLVPLTRKGTTWVALSYSTSRFDNLFHLAAYWTLVSRTPLEAPAGNASTTHAPKVFHWLYILQRK